MTNQLSVKTILVTGGAGFIGSNFIQRLLSTYDYHVINLDALTYAGNLDNLRDIEGDPRYRFVHGDICDAELVDSLMREVDAVVNFAAETHVDRSLMEAGSFIRTDILGAYVLLEAARRHGVQRFLHISTDEVYGDIAPGLSSREEDPLRPRSPYAASKAGAEMQCRAFRETYGLPVVISRGSNNIGPCQHVEKAVPLFITNALTDQPIPLYGDGLQVRDWQYVADHCRALDLILHQGVAGEAYNVGAGNERPNIEVLTAILDLLDKPRSLIRHIEDRPGHDRRYCLDSSKVRALGWTPEHAFEAALEKTVRWYVDNRWWWEKVRSGDFRDYYDRLYGARLAQGRPTP
jgi:dTDP-glucose 4,6-dehydratase